MTFLPIDVLYVSCVVVCRGCVSVWPDMTGVDPLSWGSADGKHQVVASAWQTPPDLIRRN